MSARPMEPVAVVAGGAGALGGLVAEGLLTSGHRVLVLDRAPLPEGLGGHRGRLAGERVDLTDDEQVRAAVGEWTRRWSVPRVLVNCQGLSVKDPDGRAEGEEGLSPEQFMDVLRVNLLSCFLTMRAVVPAMASAGGGRVVNVSSAAGLTGHTTASADYAAAKAGVDALTRVFAVRYGPSGVQVCAVAPGKFVSPVWRDDPGALARYTSEIPLGRLAEPSEIAEVVLFLAQERNRYLTGHTLVVDGGRLA